MKRIPKLLSILLAGLLMLSTVACGAKKDDNYKDAVGNLYDYSNGMAPNEEDSNAPTFSENPFVSTAEEPISTFSADVDTASYAYFRKLVKSGYSLKQLINLGSSFRTEEFINYFKYDLKLPENGDLFGIQADIAQTPWNPNTQHRGQQSGVSDRRFGVDGVTR